MIRKKTWKNKKLKKKVKKKSKKSDENFHILYFTLILNHQIRVLAKPSQNAQHGGGEFGHDLGPEHQNAQGIRIFEYAKRAIFF